MRIFPVLLLLLAGQAAAQERVLSAENPLAALTAEVKRVLVKAGVPFSEEQENALVLMMEERRQASEQLFGDLMDFRAGPTQGEQADRLRSAIEWLRGEFLTRLEGYLTPEQLKVWTTSRESVLAAAFGVKSAEPRQNQTQFVRVDNNAFTAEDDSFRLGRSGAAAVQRAPEVIDRGGAGSFHGNGQFLLRDEFLNAGRRFAANKPPYQERELSFNISGPIVRSRLTTLFALSRSRAENVDTIRATLPDGIFALGITRPATATSFNSRNTIQVADRHSLTLSGGRRTNSRENQGVGGFVLLERAFRSSDETWNFEVRQFSSLSARSIYETRVNISGTNSDRIPNTESLRINVLDAFSSGGAQNRLRTNGRLYEFSNLYTRLGEKFTVKAGALINGRRNRSSSEDNFIGTFTFSSLDAFQAGQPLNYRVNRGNPTSEATQWESAFFVQNDVQVTRRLTFMYGLRYELQTNLSDRNNFGPRIGVAYGLGPATVIRAGAGVFHQRLLFDIIESTRRLDGVQQYELIIDNPSYPDPAQSGSIRTTFPSVRVIDTQLATPYNLVSMVSVERTFLSTLFVSATFDTNREVRRPRFRNLNAPIDITSPVAQSCSLGQTAVQCVRPIPSRGNILNLESTGSETARYIRLSLRQRFSIFTVTTNYNYAVVSSDSLHSILVAQNFLNTTQYGLPEGIPMDSYNLRSDWAVAGTPTRHTLNATVNAQLPLGLFVTGRMNTASGRPYTILTGRDDNQDNSINDRPAGLPRNSARGPRVLSFDFNVSKAFFFGPSVARSNSTRPNVNVFANMTNAFNRPNYNPPSGVMTSPNFGRSTSAGNPREVEIGLRFQF